MIPKRLFMIWLGDNQPEYVDFSINAYKKLNPDFDVEFIRYTILDLENVETLNRSKYDDDIREMKKYALQAQPDRYANIIKFLRSPDKKFIQVFADVLRYHLLFKYGGIYVDCDTFPIKPFDDNLLKRQAFCCFPYYMRFKDRWFDMFFMGCEKGFFKDNTDFGDRVEVLPDDFENVQAWKDNRKNFYACKLNENNFIQYEKSYYIDHYIDRTWLRGLTPGSSYDDIKIEDRKKVVSMASFPPRKEGMISAIKQLLPQCDDFYLWLNEYTAIPEELNQFDSNKLHILLSTVNLKDNGRYTFIEQNKNSYFFICDDDIDWPVDYVEHTVKVLNQYYNKCIVSYFIHSEDDCFAKHAQSAPVNIKYEWNLGEYRFGSGTCAFVPENIGYYPSYDELRNGYDIEFIFGQFCHDNDIQVVSPERNENYLKWKKINDQVLCIQGTALHFAGGDRWGKTLNYIKDKNKKFLKIVIPCYNVGHTIDTMMKSILNQTCKDFFVVLVDDMSTDDTFEILKQYQKKYPQYVKAVRPSKKLYTDGARKYGFDSYDFGDFTWMVDADDKLANENVIQILKEVNSKKQCDIYTFDSCDMKFDFAAQLNDWQTTAPWFRITRSDKTVFDVLNIHNGEDVVQSYEQYDSIPDEKIFHIDKSLYDYTGWHSTKPNEENTLKIKKALSRYQFKKQWTLNLKNERYPFNECITFNGGRLGNQMYYMLQAYKQNKKYKMTINNSSYEKDLNSLFDIFKLLGMDDLIDMNPSSIQYIDTYAQELNVHFTNAELESFIRDKILKSDYFNQQLNKFGLNDKDVCIYIRCGDYLNIPPHNCFDRLDYIEKSLQKIEDRNINIVIQSDDIEYCKQNYRQTIEKHFKNIEWHKCDTILNDFIHLCSFKNKIIWNSTYSIWSAFISNIIFENSYQNIICPNAYLAIDDFSKISPAYDKRWKNIFVKEN